MSRGPAYGEPNANSFGASQRQQPISGLRMQQNQVMHHYTRGAGAFPENEERQYESAKAGGQWLWDRDAHQMSPELYSDVQGGYASKSSYSTQMPDVTLSANQECRAPPRDQIMEIGYENKSAPLSLEGLEQKLRDDLMKLMKEQVDTEDAENARHGEKIMEINNQFQEKLSAIRAQHAIRREEFLRKESHARLQQYELARKESYQNKGASTNTYQGQHGYARPPGSVSAEPARQYAAGNHFDTYRHVETFGSGRMQDSDSRVPTPGGGRAYNTGSHRY